MNKDFQEKWVAALRSGEYEQGRGVLRPTEDTYCCLGVACDIIIKEQLIEGAKWEKDEHGWTAVVTDDEVAGAILTESISKYIGISGVGGLRRGEEVISLTYLNDSGESFETIAGEIELSDLMASDEEYFAAYKAQPGAKAI